MSARQGDLIGSMLGETARPWNAAFNGQAVAVEDDSLPVIELPGGMRVTILSPRRQRLAKLRSVWQHELERAGFTPGEDARERDEPRPQPRPSQSAGAMASEGSDESVDSGGEAVASTESRLDDSIADIEGLAKQRVRLDRSDANGSSIAMLLRAQEADRPRERRCVRTRP